MKILVTGSNGFVGKNLVVALQQIKNNNDKTRAISIDEIYEFDTRTDKSLLDKYCKDVDFVYNLAGVNRPEDNDYSGNYLFLKELLNSLIKNKNTCPVMLSSSIQAALEGKYKNSDYGKSKLIAENMLKEYKEKTKSKILIYRFPNVFGKWCSPNYNSAISTFCFNYSHDLPIKVNDPNTELELVYIDDLIKELLNALEGNEHREGDYCYVQDTYNVKLNTIVDSLNKIKNIPSPILLPEMKDNIFLKKLYSTYLSYFPKEKALISFNKKEDDRGSFIEIMRNLSSGQLSINISKPGTIKGEHFHNTKWELFIVIKGNALIKERNIITNDIYEFSVCGDKPQAVIMLPGYTHSIQNLSSTDELITVIWANEDFDINHPDTYHLEV